MSWMPMATSEPPRGEALNPKTLASDLSARQHVAGIVLRALFMTALAAIILRVSMPQSTTIWTVYEDPRDLIRLGLGLAVCAWIVIELFKAPHDNQRYRTWLYLGLVAVPFAWICAIGIW